MLSNDDLEKLLNNYNQMRTHIIGVTKRAKINAKIEILEFILNKNKQDKQFFCLLDRKRDLIKYIESNN